MWMPFRPNKADKPPQDPGAVDFPGRQVVLTALAVAVVSIMVFAASAPTWADRGRIFAVASMLGGAAVAVGGLFGLIFGVPKYASAPDPDRDAEPDADRDAGSAPRYATNTNLAQISDWLTKVLVGAGLTQIGRLGPAFAALTGALAPAFGGEQVGTARVLAGSLVTFLGIFGFIVGWLGSVLVLPSELSRALERRAVKRAEREVDRAVSDAIAWEREVGQALGRIAGARTSDNTRRGDGPDFLVARGNAEVAVEATFRRARLAREDAMRVAERFPGGVVIVTSNGASPHTEKWVTESAQHVRLARWRTADDDGALHQAVTSLLDRTA